MPTNGRAARSDYTPRSGRGPRRAPVRQDIGCSVYNRRVNDLLTRSAIDQLALLADRKISALELAELHIEQIERLNPRLNALVDFDAERVREQARARDDSPGERGVLHGLPVTIKGSIAVAGHRCETGSLWKRGFRPERDAEVVRRLRAAGAVILGTTNCPEHLMAYESDNLLYGKTRNPWDLERTAGGSSGGESAAIAAGMSAGGMGSDGGGSVRTPAHMTGICALKPTPGRIPADGHLAPPAGPFTLLGTVGPMARTMADVEVLFRVVGGALETDPLAAPVAYRPMGLEAARAGAIGVLEDDGLVPVTAETRTAVHDAARVLEEAGLRVETVRSGSGLLSALEAARQLWYKLFVGCGAMLLEPQTEEEDALLSPTFREFLAIAHRDAPVTARELLGTWMEIEPVRERLMEAMRELPVLLTPACGIPAFRHGEREWMVEGQRLGYLDAMRFTQWFNLLGSPAAVVPVLRTEEGLPVGVQVAGRPWEEERVLAVEGVVDREFGYVAPGMAVG